MKITVTKWLAVAGLLCVAVAANAADQNKIATIDMSKAFSKYYQYDLMKRALARESDDIESEHKKLLEEHTKAVEDFNKLKDLVNDPAVSADEKDARQKKAEAKGSDIRDLEREIRTFEEQAQGKLETDQQRAMKKLIEDIRTAVTARAKKEGYSMVIDTSSPPPAVATTPVVLYSDGGNDITDDIIKQLNAAAPDSTNSAVTSPDKRK